MLTSAHVVPPQGADVRLFRPGERAQWSASVVWRGAPGDRDDAALLHVADPAWIPPDGSGPGWGRLVTDRPGTPCQTIGVPDVIQRPGRPVELWQATGTVNPSTGRVDNRHVLTLRETPPESSGVGTSPWGGLSGAAVFCDDLLTGVITADLTGLGHAGLEVVPAYVLHHDLDFRAMLAAYSSVPDSSGVLEPVEWQHLADIADIRRGPRPLPSPAALLRARQAVVPFRGRAEFLSQLGAWCAEPGFGVWLVHGPAGQGKTRLAHHVATELAGGRLADSRWSTVWLRADARHADLALLAAAAVPALVVVDYAETRTAQLADLLRVFARHHGGTPVKVLLLARSVEDWWENFQADTHEAEELLDGAPVTALESLEPTDGDRAGAYRQAVDSFATRLGHVRGWQHHPWPALAASLPTPALDGADTALALHMTALADLLDTAVGTTSEGAHTSIAETVEDRLLWHERRYWQAAATAHQLHPALSMNTLIDALAAAFLLSAHDQDEADALLARVPDLSDQPRDRRSAVRAWIHALYPSADARPWDSLQPDRLVERFLGRHLYRYPDLPGYLLSGATQSQLTQLLTVYARAAAQATARDRLEASLTALCVTHPDHLAEPAIEIATRSENPRALVDALQRILNDPTTSADLLERLAGQLPRTSHNLADFAADLIQRLVMLQREHADDPAQLPALARYLDRSSYRLGQLRRHEEGLAASTEAVAIWRRLDEEQPQAHLADLAKCLNSLAARLGALGHQEEALAAIQEAVEIRRELAATQPDLHLNDLAKSLNNLAYRLGKLGGHQEALAAIVEAVAIRRELAAAQPERYLFHLANNVHNMSVRLRDVGRFEEALAAVQEAVTIRRELAATRPDAFLPVLALSLNNLSARLGQAGRHDQALAAIDEAVMIRRRLATAQPAVHEPPLATCLSNLSSRLEPLGRYEEAAAAVEEAISIRRRLAAAQPSIYMPALAHGLHKYARYLEGLGRFEEAQAAEEEAASGDAGVRQSDGH
ncbi:tetratricopeptide repeat protein [Streptomyces sp. 7R015]|uniref:Tetratricopeptide repeat protein n=1 Tax=Streptomyces cylindrosporus TaxID=2927583 RepID=A0ABS9YIF8_9ACTN|nr:tetratricopeptide repeat protein [Streptomyces cylindrosporus]